MNNGKKCPTLKVFRYTYKLSMIYLIDTVGKTRPSFFILLAMKRKKYSDMLSFWISSLQVPVSPELFTDGHIVMNTTISAKFYSNHCIVYMRFRLFDMKVKKKVFPLLFVSRKGASSWAGFRKGLGMIRKANDTKALQGMWEDLLAEWIPLSDRIRSIRNYMYNHVKSKKKK